jgi:DNA modification methylase
MLERRKAQRDSIQARCEALAKVVNADTSEPWLIWTHLNDEAELLAQLIPGSVNVQGSDSAESKTKNMMAFTHGELRVLISKPKICGYGMNWQHCARMAFVGLDDSFEKFYQAVRRCYRFGQTRSVIVHLFTAENEGQILDNIKRKEVQHHEMSANMIEHMKDIMNNELAGQSNIVDEYKEDVYQSDDFTVYLGDCVKHSRRMPDASVDYSVFSPPFADLFVYSNSDHDMGNCKGDDEFVAQLRFLITELFRVLKPGRNVSFHCMNLPTTKMRQGFIGLRDFRGDLIRAFQDAGFIYHSEVAIWKDPVVAMQRTKALGLLHKTIRENSTMSRMGLPDYVVTMRKPGDCETRVTHGDDLPVMMWQKYASPIWSDINQGRTLNKLPARDENDEKHMCPLQLDVIERCIHLWTNKGDVVFSPFTGIGSEGYCAVKMGRKFIGTELKPQYWKLAVENIKDAYNDQAGLFSMDDDAGLA